jgi:hypothetical protein
MNLLLLLTSLAGLASILGVSLITVEDRRIGVGLLAGEYLVVAGLLTLAGQPGAALSRVGVAICATGILVITLRQVPAMPESSDVRGRPGRWFRLAASLLVVAAGWGMASQVVSVLPAVTQGHAEAGLTLLALGLLHLGLSEDPIRWIFGLLTAQLGFEVVYAVIEPSLAVQAILAGVHLGIVLVGSDIAVRRWPATAGGPRT